MVKSSAAEKNFDISNLYDLFQERKDCWFVCCDIQSLTSINAISRKAGDLAILETMNRLNSVSGENDIVFRMGGDKFCILTDTQQRGYAYQLIQALLELKGNTFCFEQQEIPLSLYVVPVRLKRRTIRYNELFQDLHKALEHRKN